MDDPRVQPSEIVVEHGSRRDLLSVTILVPAGVAILFGILSLTIPRFSELLGLEGILTLLVAIGFLTVWTQLSVTNEQLVLRTSGITRRRRPWGFAGRLVEMKEVRWEWLDPVPRGLFRLGFVTFRWHVPGGYLEWFQDNVSPTQARAILNYPSCPKGKVPPDLARQLGLSPNPPAPK
jgi:hypothetical protein